MKRNLGIILLTLLGVWSMSSCLEEDKAAEKKAKELENYTAFKDNYLKGKAIKNIDNKVNYFIVRQGSNLLIQDGDKVEILTTGHVITSSKPGDKFVEDKTVSFVKGDGELLDGLELGMSKLHEGDSAVILFTSEYGYGHNTYPYPLKEYSSLYFLVTVNSVSNDKQDDVLKTYNTFVSGLTGYTAKKYSHTKELTAGTGAVIALPSNAAQELFVTIDVTASNLDKSKTYASQTSYKVAYSKLPIALQEVIVGSKIGTELELYAPSKFAYGNTAYKSTFIQTEVPANTNMYFKVKLISQIIE